MGDYVWIAKNVSFRCVRLGNKTKQRFQVSVFRCQNSEVRGQTTDEKKEDVASYLISVFGPMASVSS